MTMETKELVVSVELRKKGLTCCGKCSESPCDLLISFAYDEKHATIITTNKTFGKQHKIFNDVTLTNAILDRLLHYSHIININGNSYRLKDKLKISSESSEPIQN